MELDAISFPALIIADDGWMEYVPNREQLQEWSLPAITKYNKRFVILYDSKDRVWQIQVIAPVAHLPWARKMLMSFLSTKIPVRIEVQLRPDATPEVVESVITSAIDADDDILTQHTKAQKIKSRLHGAKTFSQFVGALRATRAIEI